MIFEPGSRRNFVRKSVGTTIALAQPTIFTGLVRAACGGEDSTGGATTENPAETTVDQWETTGDQWETTSPATGENTTLAETATTYSPETTIDQWETTASETSMGSTDDYTYDYTPRVFQVVADPVGTTYEPAGGVPNLGISMKLKIDGTTGTAGTLAISAELWETQHYTGTNVTQLIGSITATCDPTTGEKTGSGTNPGTPAPFVNYIPQAGSTLETEADGTKHQRKYRVTGNMEVTNGNPMSVKVTITAFSLGTWYDYSITNPSYLADHEKIKFFSDVGTATGQEGVGVLATPIVKTGTLTIQ